MIEYDVTANGKYIVTIKVKSFGDGVAWLNRASSKPGTTYRLIDPKTGKSIHSIRVADVD